MKKRTVPKGQGAQAGAPVARGFPESYMSCANHVEYNRPTLTQKGIDEIAGNRCQGDWCGPEYARKYKHKGLYGGASTYRQGEVFCEEK